MHYGKLHKSRFGRSKSYAWPTPTKRYVVYGLYEPDGTTLRYVGLTGDNFRRRMCRHVTSKGEGAREVWIRSLLRRRSVFVAKVLDEFDAQPEAARAELAWIDKAMAQGHPLLNQRKVLYPATKTRKAVPVLAGRAKGSMVRSHRHMTDVPPAQRWDSYARVAMCKLVISGRINATAMAQELGTSQPNISQILHGDHEPSIRLAVAIEDTYGILVRWWIRPAPKKRPK